MTVDSDGEETTELGVVWKPYIMKESQCAVQETFETGEERDARIDREEMARPVNGSKLTLAMVDDYADIGAHLVQLAQPSAMTTNAPASSCQLASPSLSEFEIVLDVREATLQTQTINQGSGKFVVYERPTNVSNNKWWESVLSSEKQKT
jgi:hypothetical protein